MVNGISGFGAGMPPRMDPDAYARRYARENNISFEQAKIELEAKYGKPQQSQGMGISPSLLDASIFTQENTLQGINITTGTGGPQKEGDFRDPNREVEKYAQDNNISREEAQSQLYEKYGDPQKPQGGEANDPMMLFLNLFRGLFSGQAA